jgi:hypothetical protein
MFEHERRRLLCRHIVVRLQAGNSLRGELQELLFGDFEGQAAFRPVVDDPERSTCDNANKPSSGELTSTCANYRLAVKPPTITHRN